MIFVASQCTFSYRVNTLVLNALLEDDPDEYRGHESVVEVCDNVNCLESYSDDVATTPWHENVCEREDCLRTSGGAGNRPSWNANLTRTIPTGMAYDPVGVFQVRVHSGSGWQVNDGIQPGLGQAHVKGKVVAARPALYGWTVGPLAHDDSYYSPM